MVNFETLRCLFEEQEDKFSMWRDAIRDALNEFRRLTVEKLNLPDTEWSDPSTGDMYQYIQLTNCDGSVLRPFSIPDLTDSENVYFGMKIWLDRAVNAYPKSAFLAQLCLRFERGELVFKIKTEQDYGDDKNMNDAIEEVFQMLERALTIDPMVGGSNTLRQIGFVRT